jgi:hypothetical protein
LNTISGSLTSASPTFARVNGSSSNYYYDVISIAANTDGNYTITSDSSAYMYGYLYYIDFDPTDPTSNLYTSAFDTIDVVNFNLTTDLYSDIPYYLVMTTRDENVTTTFSINITGPGNVSLSLVAITTTTTSLTTTSNTNYFNLIISFSLIFLATIPLFSSVYSGSLTVNSSNFTRFPESTGNYYYQSIKLTINTNGNYTFTSNSTIVLYGFLYADAFDPSSPSSNLVDFGIDTIDNSNFQFSDILDPSSTYYLIVTTEDENAISSFTITVIGPNTILFQAVIITIPTTIAPKSTVTTTTRLTTLRTTAIPGTDQSISSFKKNKI